MSVRGPFAGVFGPSIYGEFYKIVNLARDLNTRVPVPEIVLVGKRGCGKTNFLEAFLDLPFSPESASGRRTRRPIFFSLVNNPEASEPRVIVKRDSLLRGEAFDHDQEVSLTDLAGVLAERNVDSEEPMYVQYEYQYCWNVTFIDTPGLLDEADGDVTPDSVRQTVLSLVAPQTRIVVSVETASDAGCDMLGFVREYDPRLDRTIFVFVRLAQLLKHFSDGTDKHINRYLDSAPRAGTCFWTSLVSGSAADVDGFRADLQEAYEADMAQLEAQQYDRRFHTQFGVSAVRKFMIELTWRRYQESTPEILKRLQTLRQKTSGELSTVQDQLSNLDTYKLRALSSNYVMSFLQSVDDLLAGTLSGNTTTNGQTLEEEHDTEEAGPWVDASYQLLDVEPSRMRIPNHDARLYGGQQFSRLLAEYRAVCTHTQVGEVNIHDVATAAGPTKLNNVSNLSWAASDLAQKKSQRALLPLIQQLFKRAKYVLKRLAPIVEHMLVTRRAEEARATAPAGPASSIPGGFGGVGGGVPGGFGGVGGSGGLGGFGASVPSGFGGYGGPVSQAGLQGASIKVEDYPRFLHKVKDIYHNFIDETAAACEAKCLDEFYCTRIIHWDLNYQQKKLPDVSGADEDSSREIVEKFAEELFNEIRDRITENVLLKCHNFLLVPMQTELWSQVQGQITVLSDDQLQELFEVSATKEKLKDKEVHLRQMLLTFQEQEGLFLAAANNFSHPGAH